MKLTDISKVSSDVLNTKLKAQTGWQLQLENLDVKKASVMLESVNEKLNAIRTSSKLHNSEKDPSFTGMLITQQVLESYIAEAKKKVVDSKKETEKSEEKVAEGKKPEFLIKAEKNAEEKEGKKDKSEKVEEATPPGAKLYGSTRHADGTKKKTNAEKLRELNKSIKDSKKEAANKKKMATESRMINLYIRRLINEDQVTQAQSVMAAKDMVDSIQKMLEDISKMMAEQLPPLVDNIRANIGDEQSAAFQAATAGSLTALMQAATGARQEINTAVLALTGEGGQPQPMGMPDAGGMSGGDDMSNMGGHEGDDDDLGLPHDGEEDPFGASDAANGGDLPMGREKRL